MSAEQNTKRPLLVTGASGGVGSAAVHLGARMGFEVVASTGRPAESGYLTELGASEVVDRAELAEAPGRPLLSERWAGCIGAKSRRSFAVPGWRSR